MDTSISLSSSVAVASSPDSLVASGRADGRAAFVPSHARNNSISSSNNTPTDWTFSALGTSSV